MSGVLVIAELRDGRLADITAEMIGAQAGAWVVRSQAYTQQALAEMMRLRAIELAGQGARLKESARFARETRDKLIQMNR